MTGKPRVKQTAELEAGKEVDLEERAPLGLGEVEHRPRQVRAHGMNEDVDRFAEVIEPVDELEPLFGRGQIGREAQDHAIAVQAAQLLGRLLECVVLAGHEQEVGSEGEQLAGAREPDTVRGAGQQHGLSSKRPALGGKASHRVSIAARLARSNGWRCEHLYPGSWPCALALARGAAALRTRKRLRAKKAARAARRVCPAASAG